MPQLGVFGVRLDDVTAGLIGQVRIASECADPERVADGEPAERSRPRNRLDVVELQDLGRGRHSTKCSTGDGPRTRTDSEGGPRVARVARSAPACVSKPV